MKGWQQSMVLDDKGWIHVVHSKLKTNSQKASLWIAHPIKPLILLLLKVTDWTTHSKCSTRATFRFFVGDPPIAKIISRTRHICRVSHTQAVPIVVSYTQVDPTHCETCQCVSDLTYTLGTPYISFNHRLDYYELYIYIYISKPFFFKKIMRK